MTKMALRSDMGAYDTDRPDGFGARGGGRRRGKTPPSKPCCEYELNGYWDDDFTNVLDHLSPEAGGISYNHETDGRQYFDYLYERQNRNEKIEYCLGNLLQRIIPNSWRYGAKDHS